jgi:TetR/AcrR family transcriptional regulator, transcriptional repressor for nem operon
MVRPRQFDEKQVVQQAMALFWIKGYASTSTRDLGAALDLRPSSLYASFGDKHALFLRSLDLYAATETAAVMTLLAVDAPARQVLRDWLVATVDSLHCDESGRGCLMVNAAAELGACDGEVASRVNDAFGGIRAAVLAVLRRGVDDGELDPELNVEQAASSLTTTMIGLRTQGRSRVDRPTMMASVEGALYVLR